MHSAETATDNGWVILIASESPDHIANVRQTLNQLGWLHRLIAVESGAEVLAYLHRERQFSNPSIYPFPNLLFVDCKMTRLSGLGVLCLMRSEPRLEHLPVVLFNKRFSREQTDTAARLRSACCPSAFRPEILIDSMIRAVRLAMGGYAENQRPLVPPGFLSHSAPSDAVESLHLTTRS